ncbi:hypothetical protein [Streptomyces sp. NPDC047071]|uniref:hypothetical protein n=1 Tax=Streptomyces sp. NPDC047071 TaxID=3154808 RepID=UPI0034544818
MITGVNTAVVWVLGRNSAQTFFTEALGLRVRTDVPFGQGVHWVTVGPKGQPDELLQPLPQGQGAGGHNACPRPGAAPRSGRREGASALPAVGLRVAAPATSRNDDHSRPFRAA